MGKWCTAHTGDGARWLNIVFLPVFVAESVKVTCHILDRLSKVYFGFAEKTMELVYFSSFLLRTNPASEIRDHGDANYHHLSLRVLVCS